MQDQLVANDTGAIELRTAPKWSAQKVHLCNRKLSLWLFRRKRAPHLVTDEEFKDFCDEISCSKNQPCSEKEVLKQTLEIVAAGKVNNRRIITKLKMQNVKPSMASDIWCDSDVSLMGTFLYYIDDKWEGLHAMVIGCTGYTGARHTGDSIQKQTVDDLATVGLTFEDGHAKVSDQGSNIKKAWVALPGGYCVGHTIELAVTD